MTVDVNWSAITVTQESIGSPLDMCADATSLRLEDVLFEKSREPSFNDGSLPFSKVVMSSDAFKEMVVEVDARI